MTVQVHYGGVRYVVKGPEMTADDVVETLREIVAQGDPAKGFHFVSDEGAVTVFPLLGPVAVLEVAPPKRSPVPPAPKLVKRDPSDGPSLRDVQF